MSLVAVRRAPGALPGARFAVLPTALCHRALAARVLHYNLLAMFSC